MARDYFVLRMNLADNNVIIVGRYLPLENALEDADGLNTTPGVQGRYFIVHLNELPSFGLNSQS
jgi:hypothetical protein